MCVLPMELEARASNGTTSMEKAVQYLMQVGDILSRIYRSKLRLHVMKVQTLAYIPMVPTWSLRS